MTSCHVKTGLLSVADLCGRTDYSALCLYAATTYGHAYPSPPDAEALLSMHLDMAADHTRTAKAVAEELLPKAEGSGREEGAIKVCKSQFGGAIVDIETARNAVRARDAGTANSYLSGIITYYSTCDDAFTEIPLPNPFAKQDDFLSKMISNALALVPIALS
ncbi:uncharacterized protein LOC141831771 [Curcuma longa]|uniref:uncharacterized protein LOC141831771 n=1 Tax=Curcuma longa TaxID=136217 RepID=UPI003D9EC79B